MNSHLPSSIDRLLRRHGSAITVRRSTGALDPVTSIRAAGTTDVQTKAVLRKRVQRSQKGDPISSEEVFYLVSPTAFAGIFEPRDADLVIDGTAKSRVMSVRTRQRAGVVLAYELHVGGVAA